MKLLSYLSEGDPLAVEDIEDLLMRVDNADLGKFRESREDLNQDSPLLHSQKYLVRNFLGFEEGEQGVVTNGRVSNIPWFLPLSSILLF